MHGDLTLKTKNLELIGRSGRIDWNGRPAFLCLGLAFAAILGLVMAATRDLRPFDVEALSILLFPSAAITGLFFSVMAVLLFLRLDNTGRGAVLPALALATTTLGLTLIFNAGDLGWGWGWGCLCASQSWLVTKTVTLALALACLLMTAGFFILAAVLPAASRSSAGHGAETVRPRWMPVLVALMCAGSIAAGAAEGYRRHTIITGYNAPSQDGATFQGVEIP
ncbi:hypothetical protein SAE02_61510 [Skermanella aerolata]|uniref:Uncharacterized protein n=1 Tax=Skermanella aerolata TaxID=393310 RepID=A0A512DZU2_9PROT|nr:hypothetical protein [Skermanella aerolata]KJB91890.1 hypothetical protein N826_25575 [Skermanella aerolata KACC 11604]GEO42003.1 hypothetical protein SAE02_61510 [Skermanella aerolata]